MRITIVTGPFFSVPPAPCGAVERLWFDMGQRFAAAGHTVTLLCRAWPGLPAEEIVGGVQVIRRSHYQQTTQLKLALIKDLFYSLAMVRRLPPADITVVNSFWLPALAPFRKRAGRVVFNVQRWPKKQMALYRRVDRLAACSTAVANEIKRQTPTLAEQVRVLPNPVDTAVFHPPATARSQRVGAKSILYTGRVNPEKGLHLLVDAFVKLTREFPEFRLKIVGPSAMADGGGGEKFVQDLREKAAGTAIEFLPPIYDRRELAEVLRAADVYCYPSIADRGESMPVAPLEAMATGLPLVVSDLPVFRDYVIDGVTGLTFDYKAASAADHLADALRRLLNSPQLANDLGRAASYKAKEFSYERVVDLYLEDFAGLVQS